MEPQQGWTPRCLAPLGKAWYVVASRMRASTSRLRPALPVALAVLFTACSSAHGPAAGPSHTTPTPTTRASASSSPVPASPAPSALPSTPASGASFSCGTAEGRLRGVGTLVLQQVTTGSHPGYDRITFRFTDLGPLPSGVTYTVSQVQPPLLQDPKGTPLAVAGSAFLAVVLHDAYGYDPLNTPPKVSYQGPTSLSPHLPTLVEAREGGDFEGYLRWYIGLSHTACWRVAQLANPPRFVLDVAAP